MLIRKHIWKKKAFHKTVISKPAFQNVYFKHPVGRGFQNTLTISYPVILVHHVHHLTFLECDLHFNSKFVANSQFITTNKMIN